MSQVAKRFEPKFLHVMTLITKWANPNRTARAQGGWMRPVGRYREGGVVPRLQAIQRPHTPTGQRRI